MAIHNLKYVDQSPIFLPNLSSAPDGVALPNKTNIISVNDREKRQLLKLKNGKKNIFEEVRPARRESVKED